MQFHSPLSSRRATPIFEFYSEGGTNQLLIGSECEDKSIRPSGYFQTFNFGRETVALFSRDERLLLFTGRDQIQVFPEMPNQSIHCESRGFFRTFECKTMGEKSISFSYFCPFLRELLLDGLELDHADLIRYVSKQSPMELELLRDYLAGKPAHDAAEIEIQDNLRALRDRQTTKLLE